MPRTGQLRDKNSNANAHSKRKGANVSRRSQGPGGETSRSGGKK